MSPIVPFLHILLIPCSKMANVAITHGCTDPCEKDLSKGWTMSHAVLTTGASAPHGHASTTATGGRSAALLDLENLAIVHWHRLRPAEMQVLLDSLKPFLNHRQVRVATGGGMLRRYLETISRGRWGVTLVGKEPDAADSALLEAGYHFIDRGVTDLVVVSGDHAFVPLASRARLHVASHADHLSKALRLAATTVTELPTPSLARGVAS
jgi:hypothetical protein